MSIIDKLDFWERDPKLDPTTLKPTYRPEPLRYFLDNFLNYPGNQRESRYAEIQQILQNMEKKGHDTRRLIDDLPMLIDMADQLLTTKNDITTKIVSKKNTTRGTLGENASRDKTRTKIRETTPKKLRRTLFNRVSMPYAKVSRLNLKYKYYSLKRQQNRITNRSYHTPTSKATFGTLKFWVRDPKFEKRSMQDAQDRNAGTPDYVSKLLNYLHKSEKNGFRRSNLIQRSVEIPLKWSEVYSSWEHKPKFKCRPSRECFENCYKHDQARKRRIPQFRRTISQSKGKNLTKPVFRGGDDDAKDAGAKEQGEKKKEPTIHVDLNPYSIFQQINDELLPKLINMDANITVEVLGRTLEYKDIVIIKATALPKKRFRADEDIYDDSAPEKKIVVIVHGLAAMGLKYVPYLSTVDGLAQLMSYYYEHLDKFDIFVIPMANPDGASAWLSGIWNKNLSPQSVCSGVALDRNFDVAWNKSQCASSSCGQQYPGTEPFSEPETKALRDVLHKYSHRIIGYFHVHATSYSPEIFKGDAVLYPKGYTDLATDDDRYVDIKAEIDDMMKNASFKVYSFTMDTLYNWYGQVSGTSVDYAASVYGIPFSMELVMQLYADDMLLDNSAERETAIVFTEVWHKVIDIIFKFMFKSIKSSDKK